MFGYYLRMALHSFGRNRLLTLLMVMAIALGIGACMSTVTILYILSKDPIPTKSSTLFYPQLDAAGMTGYVPGSPPHGQLTRHDAEALLRHEGGRHKALMTSGMVAVKPDNDRLVPSFQEARYTTSDFFALFDIAFLEGGPWSQEQDEERARIAVISKELSDRIFGGGGGLGKTVTVNDTSFRIIGVIEHWRPVPQFYDMYVRDLSHQDHIFIPFHTAMSLQLPRMGTTYCWGSDVEDPTEPNAPCAWIQFWVQLDTRDEVESYRAYLMNYSQQQREAGRFARPVNIRLRDVNEWLEFNQVIPKDVWLQAWVAAGFLLVCLINTAGLLLAKFLRRSPEIGLRRALGASRKSIFVQHLTEAATIGLAGSIPGLALAAFGLWVIRQLPGDHVQVAHLDPVMTAVTVAFALTASVLAGLLPAWWASRARPAIQLKSP
ncbi:ABC transporter permease [Marilutibacter alkalisoli]|uniref:FtsX-like permease family protein n=1 Tax=Marilutibacter alkalisoli TaxID=2591633 RepID=A0A514BNR4_9GAMM|nr:ABC transporter permease [Lysobacter alkalisoli]QDH69026.1 FtsX-like permease family protein [Lysobacter alkalisoli]